MENTLKLLFKHGYLAIGLNKMETKMIYRLLLFLILNFAALGLGGFFTGPGVSSEWYQGMEKAPWTPPGWVFGFAWTLIMICFSIYMAYLWPVAENKSVLIGLYLIQWLLNVGWNPTFFYFQNITAAFFIITGLTFLIGYLTYHYWPDLKLKSLILLPYFIWLLIATSLNGYALMNN